MTWDTGHGKLHALLGTPISTLSRHRLMAYLVTGQFDKRFYHLFLLKQETERKTPILSMNETNKR